nr:reverse transcriptase domain-containing protein [Tanacetum cinerariifolium]
MQTRSSSRLVSNPSSNLTPSTNSNPKGRNRRRLKQRIEEFNLDELSPPIVMMADQRTMAQLLQAPTEGYEDAILVPVIIADNFELKHGLLTLVQNKQFFGHDKEDPHAHIRYFNKITSTLKFPNGPNIASTSSSGTLPSNTIANPRSDLKAITTRSGVSYDGPQIPSPLLFFLRKVECLALADLGVRINLMPLSVWNKLSLLDLTHTCMTLELADSLISHPVGVAEDVYVKVGTFHFPTDFIVIDFDADPRVPLILERSFLKTEIDLIDVFEGELTLRVGKEAITFNLDQTSRYSANYNEMTAKHIDVIDMDCEEYSQEIMGFYDVITSGNPTPYYDPIDSTTSPTLTPFENSDFLLDEVDAFLALEDDPTSSEVDQSYIGSKGDVLLLEAFLNDDPSLPPPNQGNYMPEVCKEQKICEAKSEKSSIDEPPEVELKDLLPHHEYVFLEGNDKLPVIIAKDLSVDEKITLITVLKSHKVSHRLETLRYQGTPRFADFANYHAGNFVVKGMSSQQKSKFFKDVKHHFWTTPFCLTYMLIKSSEGVYTSRKPLTFSRLATMDPPGDTMAQSTQPRSDRGTYFCNDQFTKVILKFGVTHRLATPYHPQRSGRVEVSNRGLKRIIERTVGDHKKVQLNELCDQDYENSLIYKEKTKRLYDSKIKDRVFNIGDKVLLFNSQLKIFFGKLKSRSSGPFTISYVYPYGTVELSQPDEPNFKVNGHRRKHYFREDVTKTVVPDLQTFPKDH